MKNKITIKDLEVIYLEKKTQINALKISNCVFEDKINIIFGSSGSGKTTLLRALSHSLEYNGAIYFNDKNILELKEKNLNISYLSQEFVLYPNMTIFENLAYPLKNLKIDEDEIYSRVNDVANLFDFTQCLTRLPKHLSLGQQQKVAFAKALIKVPNILLMDEPFSNADPKFKEEFLPLLKQIINKKGIISLFVTHDINDGLLIGDAFYEMNEGSIKKLSRVEFEETNKDLSKR